ncbi:hypothetical protein AB0A74_35235 [Saccharothrix sp. NPDC042600]|uniref:ArsR/SmtB family transcription factor n=1 Tax=Saccharothrix TaxID=2071 RepID=UPI0033F9F378|nr:hypothetical protein GCM10017745_28170 [Saccharothrix mutabilis subsp. capreolus]
MSGRRVVAGGRDLVLVPSAFPWPDVYLTVSEPAVRAGITVGAASQHLSVLRAVGLAASAREGREVVSLRTDLGRALVEGEIR